MTMDNLRNAGPPEMARYFQRHVSKSTVSDHGFEIDWIDDPTAEIDAPPTMSQRIPVVDAGVMIPEQGASAAEIHAAIKGSAAIIAEKGLIPVTVSGSHDVTLAMLEGIKTIVKEEFALFHFSAFSGLETPISPLRLALQQNHIKGMMQFGARGVSKAERILRNELNIRWMDGIVMYSKGLHTIKDFRNNVPVYICVDLSALDPAFAPAVPHAISGGLSVRDICHVISTIRTERVIGCEITGFNPVTEIYAGSGTPDTGMRRGMTSVSAGKLMLEMIGRAFAASVMTEEQISMQIHEMRKSGKLPPDAAKQPKGGF